MHELQILLLLDPRLACRCVAQAGTFRPSPPAWTRSLNGVAVTSQILCISITLNKEKANILLFDRYYNAFPAPRQVPNLSSDSKLEFLRFFFAENALDIRSQTGKFSFEIFITALYVYNIVHHGNAVGRKAGNHQRRAGS